MLKILLKKQMHEIYRGFFVSEKTGKGKTRFVVIGSIVLFALLMIGVLGGMFFLIAAGICSPLMEVGLDWLYFLVITGIALVLGVLGSAFSTYASLYCAKDNDLLLSMPIPIGVIIASRLMSVFLMGLMFSGVVMIPAIVMYALCGASVAQILCAIVYELLLSLLVLCLSCALGWVVAKVSVYVKKKSVVTTFVMLIGIAIYFFLFSKAKNALQRLIADCVVIGARIEDRASVLAMIGRAATGSGTSLLIVAAITVAAIALIYWLIFRSFTQIATTPQNNRVRVKAGQRVDARVRSVGIALFRREASVLFCSSVYLMNCALGTFLMPVAAILLFIFGRGPIAGVLTALPIPKGALMLVAAAAICSLMTMNNITAASVSMEGKTIYITQSLPIDPRRVLGAKILLHLAMTLPPALLLSGGVIFTLRLSVAESALLILIVMLFAALEAAAGLTINILRPNLHWMTETAAVKQNISALFMILGGWVLVIVLGVIYFLLYGILTPMLYAALCALVFAAAEAILLAWLSRRGAKLYAELV